MWVFPLKWKSQVYESFVKLWLYSHLIQCQIKILNMMVEVIFIIYSPQTLHLTMAFTWFSLNPLTKGSLFSLWSLFLHHESSSPSKKVFVYPHFALCESLIGNLLITNICYLEIIMKSFNLVQKRTRIELLIVALRLGVNCLEQLNNVGLKNYNVTFKWTAGASSH